MPEPSAHKPSMLAVLAAFAAIYSIWGSTYLAIHVAIETIPPLIMAGTRYIIAGSILYAWLRLRGMPAPKLVYWRSATIVGGLMLLGGNGGVCWAELTVPSGFAALIVSCVPLWMVLLNWVRPGGLRPGLQEIGGIALGFVGVAILVNPGSEATAGHLVGAGVLVLASLFWAAGSLVSRHAVRPKSAMLSTAMQMLAGGTLLVVTGLGMGEWARLSVMTITLPSILAFAYLVVFGALIGFSAYIWLLQVSTPARVSTYAYVNPVVAVLLGWGILHEPLGVRTFLAMGIIVTAVLIITTYRRPIANRSATASQGKNDWRAPEGGRCENLDPIANAQLASASAECASADGSANAKPAT